MRRARALGSRPHASRRGEVRAMVLLDERCLFPMSDGPLRHPRVVLRNAFPADAECVLRFKVP